ncbi:hypothetical protein QYE76_062973 [Lolium multiflorum]|uniref:Retrotransposon gag domain-containing protein n=1 Tax=Lolium multiflorum TaxID=4521 RepID=A0AAD8W6L6_LOLMU|nr:hypothetical protein QYE76_062973 [Lolium multiflorum]
MGKPRDTKIAILPSTTRKGTTLSTSAALDSPSVIDKLVSPPHASRAGTSAESENSHNIDNVSAVLDDSGSLGSFLDATIAKSRQIENTETPNAATPVNSPESVDYSSDDLDEDYVELDDDFIEKCNATTDARKIKKLLAEHAVRYKPSPDPKFATSPINIRDKDYDFSLDLSHIAIVEKTPFCGTEKESAVEHMTELSTLSGLFSDDIKMRTYFVAKIFPFSLKDDAKTWYNNLPPGSIKSPKELLDVFFRKYFPASAQHAALQRIYNFDQEDGEKLPEAWARFCSLIRAQPDHDLEKHDLLDIFYSGLTIESRAYLDSCAGCVFRKRTPEDAEELLAKIGRNHDDWSTPEPTPTPIVKKRGMIKLNDEDMREAKKSLKEKGIKPEDVKNLPPIEDICETIPPSSTIEDPLYPEGHPKRVEQDSQPIKTSAPSKKKKKKHKNVVESSEPVNDPNSISISDAETESGNEHEEDNDKNDTPDKEEIEKEPEKPAKNKKYTKEDFITEKHGAVIDCNKGMVTFNVDDKEHTVYFPKRIDKDFKFNWSRSDPMVQYKIYNKAVNLPFSVFCAAIGVPQWGSCEKIRGTPRELSDLYTRICNGRSLSNDDDCLNHLEEDNDNPEGADIIGYEEPDLSGVHPNWALWKRIFFLRRNGSHNIAYNIGGVIICVRPDVEYFDVKFPNSVQGWRKRWLYIREESADSLEHNIPPFNGNEKILRRRSWDAEATDEEKSATEALMTRIHELQNTHGQELSGIQITAYFLRIRVQPLQARKNPLWMYAGDKDVDRLSIDLSVKDLEKLVRKISSLSKKDAIPTSCRVVPYSGTNALPQRSRGNKPAASSGKEAEFEASESTQSIPSADSPKKRKRSDVEGSGTSKLSSSPVEETAPEGTAPEEMEPFNAYEAALVSSGDEEEEEPAANVTAPMSMSHTLALSETHRTAEETSTPHPDLQRSTPATSPRASSPKRARIELGEEFNLAGGSATPPLYDARIFVSAGKMSQDFVLEKPEDDRLLDALSLLEIHAHLVRRTIFDAHHAFSRLFPYFFPKKKEPDTFAALAKSFIPQEDLGLALRQENLKIGVEGTIALVAESQQHVDWAKVDAATKLKQDKWPSLIRAAKPHSKKILAFLGYKPTPSSNSAKPEVK